MNEPPVVVIWPKFATLRPSRLMEWPRMVP